VIVFLNGAFGIGKTKVARLLVAHVPRACVFDPEVLGMALQRVSRLTGRRVDDFQDLPSWRRLTIAGLRIARLFYPIVIVPMAFSEVSYLNQIREGVGRFEPSVLHFCLVAPFEVVRERLLRRGHADVAWQCRRASECCRAHRDGEFARHVDAVGRNPEVIALELAAAIGLTRRLQ
jgi:hypothetical protein